MRAKPSSLYLLSLRVLLPFTLLLLLSISVFGQNTPMQAQQADAFVDSIGIGTDITYNGIYQCNWAALLQALQNLGVRHIRDGYFTNNNGGSCPATGANYGPQQWILEHQQLAQSGIRTDYVIPYSTSTTAQQIEDLSSQVQDMEAVEAPNECDNPESCGGNNPSSIVPDMSNMLSFLPTVHAAGSALGIPVIGPSFAHTDTSAQLYSGAFTNGQPTSLSFEITDNNLHIYFLGLNPATVGYGETDSFGNNAPSFNFWLDQADLDANVPVWETENGYVEMTSPAECTVPMDIAASYIPRTLLLAFQAGLARTYLFQLVTDPLWNQGGPGQGNGDYGLLNNSDLSPRPAFTAVQQLIANLSDPGPSFTPHPLPVSITGGDSTLQKVLLQKRDGSFWLILWLEQRGWDPECGTGGTPGYTPVPPQNVTITLDNFTNSSGQTVSSYQIPNYGQLDEETGDLNWTSLQGPYQTTLPISDELTIVKILPNH